MTGNMTTKRHLMPEQCFIMAKKPLLHYLSPKEPVPTGNSLSTEKSHVKKYTESMNSFTNKGITRTDRKSNSTHSGIINVTGLQSGDQSQLHSRTEVTASSNKVIFKINYEKSPFKFEVPSAEQKLESNESSHGTDKYSGTTVLKKESLLSTTVTGSLVEEAKPSPQKGFKYTPYNEANRDFTFNKQGFGKAECSATTSNAKVQEPGKAVAAESISVVKIQEPEKNKSSALISDSKGQGTGIPESSKTNSDVKGPVIVIHNKAKFIELSNLKVGEIVDKKTLLDLADASKQSKQSNTISVVNVLKKPLCKSRTETPNNKTQYARTDMTLINKEFVNNTEKILTREKDNTTEIFSNKPMSMTIHDRNLHKKHNFALNTEAGQDKLSPQKREDVNCSSSYHSQLPENAVVIKTGPNKKKSIILRKPSDIIKLPQTDNSTMNEFYSDLPLSGDKLSRDTNEALSILHRNGYSVSPIMKQKLIIVRKPSDVIIKLPKTNVTGIEDKIKSEKNINSEKFEDKKVLTKSAMDISKLDPKVPLNVNKLPRETVEALSVLHRNGYNVPPLIRKKNKQIKKNAKGCLPKVKCILPSCAVMFNHVKNLIDHLDEFHRANIDIVDLNFDTYQEFWKWKQHEETELCVKFSRPRAPHKNKIKGHCLETYVCYKSGHYKPTPTKIGSKPRARSSVKINGLCLARMYVKHIHSKYLETEPYVKKIQESSDISSPLVNFDVEHQDISLQVRLPEQQRIESRVTVKYVKTHNHSTGIKTIPSKKSYKKKKKVSKKTKSEQSSTVVKSTTDETQNKKVSPKNGRLKYKNDLGITSNTQICSSSDQPQTMTCKYADQLNMHENGSGLNPVQHIAAKPQYITTPHCFNLAQNDLQIVSDPWQSKVGSVTDSSLVNNQVSQIDYHDGQMDNISESVYIPEKPIVIYPVYGQQTKSVVVSNPGFVVASHNSMTSSGYQTIPTANNTGSNSVQMDLGNNAGEIFVHNNFVPETSMRCSSNVHHSSMVHIENDDNDDSAFSNKLYESSISKEETVKGHNFGNDSVHEKVTYAKQLLKLIERQINEPLMPESQLDYVIETLKTIHGNNIVIQNSMG